MLHFDRFTSFLEVAALRDVSSIELASRRDDMPDLLYHRAKHVVGEMERTLAAAAAAALKTRDWQKVGQLMYARHDSLRDDYQGSCPELDALVEAARQIGFVIRRAQGAHMA